MRALAIAFFTLFCTFAIAGAAAEYFNPSRLAAYFSGEEGAARETYRTAEVERGSIARTVAATGSVQAVATVRVGTQVSGQISEILADFNTEVREGDVIARIDPLSFRNEVEKSRAEVEIAKAVLMKAEVALKEAEEDEERKRRLTLKGAGSAVEFTKATAAKGVAAAEVQNAAATLAKAKTELKQSELNLERTQIRSPVNGVVIQRNVEQGQTVAAELQAPTLFIIAQDLRAMQLELSVDEADIGKVAAGQRVDFTVDTFPGRRFSGEVLQVRKYPVVTENVTTYAVIASAPNPDLALIPGLTALARVVLKSKDAVLTVPRAALRFRPKGTPFSGPAVWVLGPSGLIERRVKTGLSNASSVEVEGQLQPGEHVVVGASREPQSDTPRWTLGSLN